MQNAPVSAYAETGSRTDHNEAHSSGVSWAAVFAGALTTAALSLILLSLGTGLGLSSVSPWSGVGASASAIGASTIIWLIVMEILSSSMGGYLAGRLRTKWAGIHNDEVYFRDTAHGFLAWSTALVLTAAFLASAATTLIGDNGASKSAASSQVSSRGAGSNSYFVDRLFRSDGAKDDAVGAASREEAAGIFARGLTQKALGADDRSYLDQLVSAKANLSSAAADARVSAVFTDAQQDAETTRKAIAHSLLWMFIALLIGAFCASLSATIGGKQRDNVVLL